MNVLCGKKTKVNTQKQKKLTNKQMRAKILIKRSEQKMDKRMGKNTDGKMSFLTSATLFVAAILILDKKQLNKK